MKLLLSFLLILCFNIGRGQSIDKDKEVRYQVLIRQGDSLLKLADTWWSKYWDYAQSYYNTALSIHPDSKHVMEQICKIWINHLNDCTAPCTYCKGSKAEKLKYSKLIAVADSFFGYKNYATAEGYYNYALTLQPYRNYAKKQVRFCDSIQFAAEMTFDETTIDIDSVYYYMGHLLPKDYVEAKAIFKNTGSIPLNCQEITPYWNEDTGKMPCILWKCPHRVVKPGEMDTLKIFLYPCAFESFSGGRFKTSVNIGCNSHHSSTLTITGCLLKVDDISGKTFNKLIQEFDDSHLFHASPKYTDVQKTPQFPGGNDSLQAYLERKTYSKQQAINTQNKGSVWVTFIIEKDGTASNVEKESSQPSWSDPKEAIEAIKSMPKWISGKQYEHPVRVQMQLQVWFRTDKN
jgi:hypothetical protein